MTLQPWSSLDDQCAVAAHLYGPKRGHTIITDWLDQQLMLVGDKEFGRPAADSLKLPGTEPIDYAHRLVTHRGQRLLGGIRFYGRDAARPFVEVIAHSFSDLDLLRDCARVEWARFHPRYLRMRARPNALQGPNACLDVSIHAARYDEMVNDKGDVTLTTFADAEEAVAIVERRQQQMEATDPSLARNLTLPNAADLRAWHTAGSLTALSAAGQTVGLWVAQPGDIAWLVGDEILAEVIDPSHSGCRYAAAAQSAWAAHAGDQSRLLIGMIDRLNVRSRATAQRAGRPSVLNEYFIRLTEKDTDTPTTRACRPRRPTEERNE